MMGFPAGLESMLVSHHVDEDVAWVIATPKSREMCDDRAAVAREGDDVLLVVADGATGVGFGGAAADAFVGTVMSAPHVYGLSDRFLMADRIIGERGIDGDTTGIAIIRAADGIVGCSAGDSEAWFFPDLGSPLELTAGQAKRPRIGNGAFPCPFAKPKLPKGVVVAGTDGFWRWTDRTHVNSIMARSSIQGLPEALLMDLLERFGPLDDDVTIAVMNVR